MSNNDPVIILLERLYAARETIAESYHRGRIHKTEENARDIERLRQVRLLSPDIRDAFQLRAVFRQFLNATLNTERLFSMGANIGELFSRLQKLVDEHSIAFQESRDADCERYEYEAREAISDIADAIEDELIILQAQVETRFAAVSTIAEKKRQNLHYQQRTQMLVNLLENFHFSDIGEQLQGHEDLALSFKSLLADRMPAFREALLSILVLLNQYLFEFRKIEERSKRVRAFALHLNRNADWEPKAWDDTAAPPEWLQLAAPVDLQFHPDVGDQSAEDTLSEIARSIPETANLKIRETRPAGSIEDGPANIVIKAPQLPIRKAIRAYFKEAKGLDEGVSARKWWAIHPDLMGSTREEIWLLRVLAEHDNKGKAGDWAMRTVHTRDEAFDGNILIHDVVISGRRRNA